MRPTSVEPLFLDIKQLEGSQHIQRDFSIPSVLSAQRFLQVLPFRISDPGSQSRHCSSLPLMAVVVLDSGDVAWIAYGSSQIWHRPASRKPMICTRTLVGMGLPGHFWLSKIRRCVTFLLPANPAGSERLSRCCYAKEKGHESCPRWMSMVDLMFSREQKK